MLTFQKKIENPVRNWKMRDRNEPTSLLGTVTYTTMLGTVLLLASVAMERALLGGVRLLNFDL